MDFMCKVNKQEEMVLASFACTLMTTKACLPLSAHCWAVECEDSACSPHSRPSLPEVYRNLVSGPEYDITVGKEAVEERKVLATKMVPLASKRMDDNRLCA